MTTKSATELLNDMATLQYTLRNVCPHCGEATLRWVTDTSVDCVNPACPAEFVTLPVEQFITLTPAQLATYESARRSLRTLDADQETFDNRIESIKAAAAKRAAARARGERCFG
jgi:hypothetical protein